MPNKARPKCPQCDAAMQPVYFPRPRGESVQRVPETFYCPAHDLLSRGRNARQRVFLNRKGVAK